MKNWRGLFNGMIQTRSKHVWLWDDKGGVAVKVTVPSYPWKKIDPDFTHWMAATSNPKEEFPAPPADATNIATGTYTITAGKGITLPTGTTTTVDLAGWMNELIGHLKDGKMID